MYFSFLNTHFVTLCEQPSKMSSLAVTLASSADGAVFDDVLRSISSSPSNSLNVFARLRWTTKCLSVHVPSFDAVSSIRTTIISRMNHPAVRLKLNTVNSGSYFLADGQGVGIRIMMEAPHRRTTFPGLACSRVIALDFDPALASLYMLVVKETPRGGGFSHRPVPDTKQAVAASVPSRNGATVHPGDFLFKARQKHTRPDAGDCAEDFAGFATLDTTLQLLRCSEGNEPEAILVSAAAGNLVHSMVLSHDHDQPAGGVIIVLGAKQLTPEFVQECKALGILTFRSSTPLAHDDCGCTVTATSPLCVTLHCRGEGVAATHWAKTTVSLAHNAQFCSVSPDGRALAVMLSNCSLLLFLKSAVSNCWLVRGRCMPRPSVSLRAIAVARMSGAGTGGSSGEDALVAISSATGIIQVWHFTSSPPAAATAGSETTVSRSPPKRGVTLPLDSAPDAPMMSYLCGLHSVGACAARDDIPLAFVRTSTGGGDDEGSFGVAAADAAGTLRMFDVRATMCAKRGNSECVMLISGRGDRKREQIMPAVGHAAAVTAFQLLAPSSVVTLDATGMIMMQCARTSTLHASSDGCDITRVECFAMRDSVAIGSALPPTHVMNLAQHESYMFTGSSDGTLSAFDKQFVCYWRALVCDCSITCLSFSSDTLLYIGCDNGRMLMFNMSRCAVEWSVMMHSSRVLAIDAADQHTASMSDDGSLIISDKDGIAAHTLRCDTGWCGARFTRARSLAAVTTHGKLQLRSMDSMPPKAAAHSDTCWPHRVEVDADSGGRRCTAFDIIEDAVGSGVAVLAIGQAGADDNAASDVTAVIVDLAFKVVVAKYRGPSAAITRIAFASGNWSLLPSAKRQDSRGGSKPIPVKDASVADDSQGRALTGAGGERHHAAGGVECLSGVNAIVASCRDGTGTAGLTAEPLRLSVCVCVHRGFKMLLFLSCSLFLCSAHVVAMS